MMTLTRRWASASICAFVALGFSSTSVRAQHSAAREWNELLLESIRNDFARPTIHARNLYHVSVAMWDAWATFDPTAKCVIFEESHPTTSASIDLMREEALSYACYRLLRIRFRASPGHATLLPLYDALMAQLGYSPANTSTVGNSPAAIGNRLALAIMAFGAADNSNESHGFANRHYLPINPPLLPAFPGNPHLNDPSRWQPLALQYFISQSGFPIPGGYPPFLSPEWGQVTPFALSQNNLTVQQRGGFDYWLYHDPGAPPRLGTPTASDYKTSFEMVAVWSGHLDPTDGVMIDVSPASIGNATLPTGPSQYAQFYDFDNGGDWGTGYPANPVTGQPYAAQIVPRGDYCRVLAEFWADGPDSETPPGHWFVILNHVSDHALTIKRIGGVGPVVNNLEWDVKAYLALAGAMQDSAVAAWGVKGWYDFARPISAIRYMADRSAYNPNDVDAITLRPGQIELVTSATTAPGQRHAHLAGNEGKIAIKAWRGPTYIQNPATDTAGVGWILAENWWPYQRPTFVTPPFAGYVSGHSTYSRAAAVMLHRFTGSPWFPGGLGEFVCPQNNFLVFERGPSVTVTLQWASYYDASDQTSLSRIWGGIHPPADDIPGRKMGQRIGNDAFDRAQLYWAGNVPPLASYSTFGVGCPGSNGTAVTLNGLAHGRAVLGSLLQVEVSNLPAAAPLVLMTVGTTALTPGNDLGVLGAPGCTAYVDVLFAKALSPSGGHATWANVIPNNPSWLGQSLFHQVATLDPGANALGLTTSNAGNAVVGL